MKNLLIVGASKGIGLSLAEMAAPVFETYTVSRTWSPELSALNTHHFSMDAVHDPLDSLESLPEVVHGLVYCPGSITLKTINRLSEADFLGDFHQNVLGAVRVIQFCLPRLKRAKGASVVLFSTVAAQTGMAFHSSVAAAKAGVEGLGKSLAAELAPQQIRVNVIAPSLTQTPLAQGLLNSPEKAEAAAKRHPLQRIGQAADMAAIAHFLLSDQASWITGQVIGVDGGLSTLRS
ncbi:MAG: 3-oxoacyl-[acyl-carrier-protein] reductase FabG [Bacteroidota bacterium]|jgi:3-oxoacyl-[acyl-carrier protein] reductase